MRKIDPKPWRLEYQWKSPQDFNKYCVRATRDDYSNIWRKSHGVYADLNKARIGVHKTFMDPYFNALVVGRNWRLKNTSTKEVVPVIITEKEIKLIIKK